MNRNRRTTMNRILHIIAAGVALSVVSATCGAFAAECDVTEMFEFVPSFDSPDNVVNMRHLLEAPAGKDGRVRVEGGHFVNDKGRVKLHATNLTGPANFPTHEEADRLADRLARFGFNCVRLHYFDSSYGYNGLPKQQGIFVEDPKTNTRFDPERRDRQDYLIAAFKKHGIYVNINLHVARHLDERDGIPSGTQWANKGANQFYPPLIEAQRKYAKELLSHVNPYTGMSYLKDPVVAMVELNNEDSMWFAYFRGNFDKLGAPYAKLLKAKWNDWLLKRYGSTEKVREAWKLKEKPFPYLDPLKIEKGEYPCVQAKKSRAPDMMRADYYRFFMDVEGAYWTSMRDYLKNDLGLEAPVSGTQLGYSTPHLQAELDYVDAHAYWQHPKVKMDWRINNIAMVNSRGGCVANLAARRVEGKPFTISEYNHPYPNFYGAEGQPMLRAYGAFQGWDGVFEYSYNNRQGAEPDFNEYFFSIVARTDVLAHIPACAAMYLRGDVKESPANIVVNLPCEKGLEHMMKTRTAKCGINGATDGKLPLELALAHKVSVDVTGRTPPFSGSVPELGKRIVSDTKELVWDNEIPEKGAWTVNTPNTKVFSGFPNGRVFDLGGVKIAVGETKLGWATVSLTSHDATGFGEGGRPSRILLAATGLSHNKDADFAKPKGGKALGRGKDWGHGPVVNEGIPAEITLPSPAAKTVCRALDERGEPKADVPVTADAEGRAVLKIGPDYKTVWYEIVISA